MKKSLSFLIVLVLMSRGLSAVERFDFRDPKTFEQEAKRFDSTLEGRAKEAATKAEEYRKQAEQLRKEAEKLPAEEKAEIERKAKEADANAEELEKLENRLEEVRKNFREQIETPFTPTLSEEQRKRLAEDLQEQATAITEKIEEDLGKLEQELKERIKTATEELEIVETIVFTEIDGYRFAEDPVNHPAAFDTAVTKFIGEAAFAKTRALLELRNLIDYRKELNDLIQELEKAKAIERPEGLPWVQEELELAQKELKTADQRFKDLTDISDDLTRTLDQITSRRKLYETSLTEKKTEIAEDLAGDIKNIITTTIPVIKDAHAKIAGEAVEVPKIEVVPVSSGFKRFFNAIFEPVTTLGRWIGDMFESVFASKGKLKIPEAHEQMVKKSTDTRKAVDGVREYIAENPESALDNPSIERTLQDQSNQEAIKIADLNPTRPSILSTILEKLGLKKGLTPEDITKSTATDTIKTMTADPVTLSRIEAVFQENHGRSSAFNTLRINAATDLANPEARALAQQTIKSTINTIAQRNKDIAWMQDRLDENSRKLAVTDDPKEKQKISNFISNFNEAIKTLTDQNNEERLAIQQLAHEKTGVINIDKFNEEQERYNKAKSVVAKNQDQDVGTLKETLSAAGPLINLGRGIPAAVSGSLE